MININEIYRIKKILLQYWLNSNIISTQVLLSYPSLQKCLTFNSRAASPNIFIKKKVDIYSFPNKKKQLIIEKEQKLSSKKLSIVSQEPVIISKRIPSFAVQKAYSINSNQWNGRNSNSSTLLINNTKITNNNESKYQSIKHETIKSQLVLEESSTYNIYNNRVSNKTNLTIEQSQNEFDTLSLSTINLYESEQLSSTRNNIETIRDRIDIKATRTITAKSTNSISSCIKRDNNINKSDLHYKNVNNYIEESSLEDIEERLNNDFLNNKYDIPLQINVSMFFEKRGDDIDNNKLYKNMLKESKINIK